jgi:hypothetical protein
MCSVQLSAVPADPVPDAMHAVLSGATQVCWVHPFLCWVSVQNLQQLLATTASSMLPGSQFAQCKVQQAGFAPSSMEVYALPLLPPSIKHCITPGWCMLSTQTHLSAAPCRDMNYLRFMERLLRLAVPNTAVWLAMFYLVFHLWLNIIGELLMFGDRMFYKVRAWTY